MAYSYRCTECYDQTTQSSFCSIGGFLDRTCHCGGRLQRIISPFQFSRPMQEHYNASVGKPISSSRQFSDELKRQSEAASVSTGIEHNYQPVDPSDTASLGVTEEGLYETKKRRHDAQIT